MKGPLGDEVEHRHVNRLLIEIVGALGHGSQSVVALAVACHHNNLRMRRETQDVAQAGKPLLYAFGIRRQAEVLQYHHRLMASQLHQSLFAGAGSQYVIAFEMPLQLAQQTRVVFDHQEFRFIFHIDGLRIQGDFPETDGAYDKSTGGHSFAMWTGWDIRTDRV